MSAEIVQVLLEYFFYLFHQRIKLKFYFNFIVEVMIRVHVLVCDFVTMTRRLLLSILRVYASDV